MKLLRIPTLATCIVFLGMSVEGVQDKKGKSPVKQAYLGVTSHAIKKRNEREYYKLPANGDDMLGQLVDSVDPGSPAARAGIAKGDVLIKLGNNGFYSRDSLEDYLRATPTGTKVTALLKRGKTLVEEELTVVLGEQEWQGMRFPWTYAGLAQYEAALAQAKKEGKRILLGLSGSES